MLTQLRFQNFKSWRDTQNIRMAPLTGFFGTNSSGKTSILQFLLMLKQTAETSDRNRVLHTGDSKSYVNLGSTYDFIHKHKLPGEISFEMKWKPSSPELQPTLLTGISYESNAQGGIKMFPISEIYSSEINFNSQIKLEEKSIKVQDFSYSYKLGDDYVNLGAKLNRNDKYTFLQEGQALLNAMTYTEARGSGGVFSSSFNLSGQEISCPEKFYTFPRDLFSSFSFSAGIDLHSLMSFYENVSDLPESLALSLEQQFQRLYYIGPLREYPQRYYDWSGERPEYIGQRGEYFISALLASDQQNLEVQTKVAYWLKELKLIHEFKLEPLGRKGQQYEVLVRCRPDSAEASLADIGFGISQVLPILVLCYYVPEGSTIILEQPELHLHPLVQSGLADVFIDVIKTRNVQIILESHSEHLLRRLQRRIAESAKNFTNEDAALYFCDLDDTGTSHLGTLQIDSYGNITNWPENFFGDEMGDLVAMTEAAMHRQMQERPH
jgi:AAA15 family ATPase/GTPase